MHPHVQNLKELTDSQLEQKIYKLNSLYFMTGDQNVRHQMILLLDTYKIELDERRAIAKKKQEEQGRDDLDNLINIS
jgi:hypothetical protein